MRAFVLVGLALATVAWGHDSGLAKWEHSSTEQWYKNGNTFTHTVIVDFGKVTTNINTDSFVTTKLEGQGDVVKKTLELQLYAETMIDMPQRMSPQTGCSLVDANNAFGSIWCHAISDLDNTPVISSAFVTKIKTGDTKRVFVGRFQRCIPKGTGHQGLGRDA